MGIIYHTLPQLNHSILAFPMQTLALRKVWIPHRSCPVPFAVTLQLLNLQYILRQFIEIRLIDGMFLLGEIN